jgi:type I restriction enzyme S subunit
MSSKIKNTAAKEEAKYAPVPKLRFPEFRDATGWKQTPLGDCLDYQQPTPYLVADTQYSPAYKTPVLTAGKTFILGYTDEQHGIFSAGLPVIIFDDFTTATQFVDFPFKAKSSAMKILEARNGADIKFMYETLQTLSYEVGAHERHWISNFAAMLLPVPKPAEQKKIAECLSSVDALMAAQTRKVAALKTHKKGLMQQLFPREGETQPRLRFPEFQNAGEWKLRKAGTFFANRVTKGEEGLPIYSVTMHDGMIKRDSFDRNFYDIEEAKGNKKVCKGDIAYNMMRMWQGALGVAPEDCLVSPAYIVLAPMKDTVPVFFQYLFKLPDSLLLLTSHSRGLTKDRLRLYYDDFASIALRSPAPLEQRRIATYLCSLDALINAETQKLEAFKAHKKGLMQQLFPSPEDAAA